jgi:hypothetical protein
MAPQPATHSNRRNPGVSRRYAISTGERVASLSLALLLFSDQQNDYTGFNLEGADEKSVDFNLILIYQSYSKNGAIILVLVHNVTLFRSLVQEAGADIRQQ